ncbi:MAG TPA: DNA-directed RNA polymerase subunit omega [Massilibacterium sp.]|nr:DNA-directed RNA polymerase subunit omega [Massilibacterium sp.]
MLNPSIDELLKVVDSKYTLVTVSARRAREIQETNKTYVENPMSHKAVGKALEEINEDKLNIIRPNL